MAVLSFNSRVVAGRVGHGAAQFALERLGHDVWPVDTVILSNHPGHGRWRGAARPPAALAELVAGLADLGLLDHCRMVMSGYLGEAGTARVVADAVDRIRDGADVPFVCDPVMGDAAEGLYVAADTADAIAGLLLPRADVLLPNAFELARLAGRPVTTAAEALDAALALRDHGVATVIATSVPAGDDAIANVLVTAQGAWQCVVPRIATAAKGAGDLFAGVYAAAMLAGLAPAACLARAAGAVRDVLAPIAAATTPELLLAGSGTALTMPGEEAVVVPLPPP